MSSSIQTTTQSFPRKDIASSVTSQIIAKLESGVLPWTSPWSSGTILNPLRHGGESYRGINTLLLWIAAEELGYTNPYWMTFQQAKALGGHVRKGEHSQSIVYYGTAQKHDADGTAGDGGEGGEDGKSHYRFLKCYSVFNVQQIDGLPERYTVTYTGQRFTTDRIPKLDAIIAGTRIEIRHGGDKAYYHPGSDFIQMPEIDCFADIERYYCTLFHEAAHGTQTASRCDRKVIYQGEGRALEELVAEISSAFVGAAVGFRPDHIDSHASYIGSWLQCLKNDKRFIFKAAALAQQAADFILYGRAFSEEREAA